MAYRSPIDKIDMPALQGLQRMGKSKPPSDPRSGRAAIKLRKEVIVAGLTIKFGPCSWTKRVCAGIEVVFSRHWDETRTRDGAPAYEGPLCTAPTETTASSWSQDGVWHESRQLG